MSSKHELVSESKNEVVPCESCLESSQTLRLICARCNFVSGLPMHSRSLFILEPELKFQGPHCVHMTDVFYKSMLTVFKHRVLHFWHFPFFANGKNYITQVPTTSITGDMGKACPQSRSQMVDTSSPNRNLSKS